MRGDREMSRTPDFCSRRFSTDAKGPVGIQHHGEKGQTYRFRNLRIKELKGWVGSYLSRRSAS